MAALVSDSSTVLSISCRRHRPKHLFHVAGVYTITNTQTGHIYVGRSERILMRWRGHLAVLRSGSAVPKFQEEWNTYGPDAFIFTVVEEVDRNDNIGLRVAEQRWMNQLKPVGLYNPTLTACRREIFEARS